jgi:hypothetical protein
MATADSEDVSDSESGSRWGKHWKEIYIEGMMMVKTATPYQCFEDYLHLWDRVERKKKCY